MLNTFEQQLEQVRACNRCAEIIGHTPRPVLRGSADARLLIVGQAPGRLVHETGLPFNDPSGRRLREWMGIDRDTFYNEAMIAFLPMAFCYPGTGKGGDLPPPPLCAETWRRDLLATLRQIQLTLLIGQYAQAWHLYPDKKRPPPVTETVANWRAHWPGVIPLPHPSFRNNLWLKRNPWFERELLPMLRQRVWEVLEGAP